MNPSGGCVARGCRSGLAAGPREFEAWPHFFAAPAAEGLLLDAGDRLTLRASHADGHGRGLRHRVDRNPGGEIRSWPAYAAAFPFPRQKGDARDGTTGPCDRHKLGSTRCFQGRSKEVQPMKSQEETHHGLSRSVVNLRGHATHCRATCEDLQGKATHCPSVCADLATTRPDFPNPGERSGCGFYQRILYLQIYTCRNG